MVKFKGMTTLISLVAYVLAFMVNPVYAGVQQNHQAAGIDSKKSDTHHDLKQLSSEQLDKLLKAGANGKSSFQSQAGNASLPITASVNPATLQFDFSAPLAQVRSGALSELSFGIHIINQPSQNPLNAIFNDKSLSLNLPYLQLISDKDGKQYYNLNANSEVHPFVVSKDKKGEQNIRFYYSKKAKYKVTSISKSKIQFVGQDGTTYLFEKLPSNPYLYVIKTIIDAKGSQIHFNYLSKDSIEIRNNANNVVARIVKTPGLMMIRYQDALGRWQVATVTDNDVNTVTVTNALNESTQLQYGSNNKINNIIFPNQSNYRIKYHQLDQVNYIIDGKTKRINYDHSYVSELQKHLNNKHNADQVYHYHISEDGNNFAGNNIWCSQKVFDHLNPLEDWLMECGFEHHEGNYSYSTQILTDVPVFDGQKTVNRLLKVTNGYNYLHLPINTLTTIDGKNMRYQQYYYDQSIDTAKDFDQLSLSYQNPIKVSDSIYDASGHDRHQQLGIYQYYGKQDKGQQGVDLGEIKTAIDGSGNRVDFSYYAQNDHKNNYQTLVKNQRMQLYQDPRVASIENSAPKWLEQSVDVDGTSIQLAAPYTSHVTSYKDGAKTRGVDVQTDTNPSSLTYGLPINSTKTINGDHPYIKSQIHVDQVDNLYRVSASKAAVIDDTNGKAPTKVAGAQKFFNQYGGLVKVVDPYSGDIVQYDDYDALGRVKQISYLPGGNSDYRQVYQFSYGVNQDQSSYVVTTKTITPTTGKAGYSTKTYYNQENQVIQVAKQTKDRQQYFTTQENFYNHIGKIDHVIHYRYDEQGQVHPQTTRYFYNEKQQVMAVQTPTGKTLVHLNDAYHHRQISYTLHPTGQVTQNTDSLCFDPMASKDGKKVYNTCQVSNLNIHEDQVDNVGSANRPIWSHKQSYEYSLIMLPEFNYMNSDGREQFLYTTQQKQQLKQLNQNIAQGRPFKAQQLNEFVNQIKDVCLNGNTCPAGSFKSEKLDQLGQVTQSENKLTHLVTHNIFGTKDPTQLIAQTLSVRQSDGDLNALKTMSYTYDRYGNLQDSYISQGSYADNQTKTLVGEKNYTALGYLLSASSLINNRKDQIQITYNTQTGLPETFTDLKGNKIIIHYDDPTWKLKPSSAEFDTESGKKDFVITYDYNANGDLATIAKKDSNGKLVSQTDYHYDPVTLSLNKTTITYPDGSKRSLVSQVNQYNIPESTTYQSDGQKTLEKKAKTTPLGLIKELDYSGVANYKLTMDYNADLKVSQLDHDNQKLRGYDYDDLGRISHINNYLGDTLLRSYGYRYNRLGQKAQRTAETETGQTQSHYHYNPQLGQLIQFDCQGAECPYDANGSQVSQISYHYDDLFNKLLSVDSTAVNGNMDQTIYDYDNQDPTQVTSVISSNGASTKLSYDANGNVQKMTKQDSSQEKSHYSFHYDAQNNLTQLDIDQQSIHYTYDANDQQIAQSVQNANGEEKTQYNYYLGGDLSEQTIGDESRYYVGGGSIDNGNYQPNLIDGFNVTGSIQDGQVHGNYVYTPYGYQTDLQKAQKMALNLQATNLGYRTMNTDQVTGWQFLGNGYRAYNPELRIFMQHDSASPFGAGGINAYSYSSNDPVNGFDPSGHATQKDMISQNKVVDQFIKQWKSTAIIAGVALIVGILTSFIPGGVMLQLFIGTMLELVANVITTGVTMGWSVARSNIGVFLGASLLNAVIGMAFIGAGMLLVRVYAVFKYLPEGTRMSKFFSNTAIRQMKSQAERANAIDQAFENVTQKIKISRTGKNAYAAGLKNNPVVDLNRFEEYNAASDEQIRSLEDQLITKADDLGREKAAQDQGLYASTEQIKSTAYELGYGNCRTQATCLLAELSERNIKSVKVAVIEKQRGADHWFIMTIDDQGNFLELLDPWAGVRGEYHEILPYVVRNVTGQRPKQIRIGTDLGTIVAHGQEDLDFYNVDDETIANVQFGTF